MLAHPLPVYDVWKKFKESLALLQMERISGKQQPTGLNTQFSEMRAMQCAIKACDLQHCGENYGKVIFKGPSVDSQLTEFGIAEVYCPAELKSIFCFCFEFNQILTCYCLS